MPSDIQHMTLSQPRLSIIVPIYGVEQYLRKCVDSLLAQDYDDYEIILVDDGSPDSCPQICDEYAGAYPQPLPKRRGDKPMHDTFASVWGAHTADSTQYDLLKANAEKNRKNPTDAESILWDMLKGNNIGLHFRRQHIVLNYIVDFICIEKGLVIELDGGYHNDPEQKEQDERRTAHLQQLGYTELRFANEELLTNPDAVIARIKEVAISLPSLQGRGGERLIPISVIHRENGGLSAARNSGIEVARGEYIMFVDSDDYLEPNVLGTLMAQIERDNLDVLRFNYQNVRVNSAGEYELFQPYKSPHQVDGGTDVVSGETYLDERMGYACYACQFVINRELTGSFTPGIHFEDTEWLPRMMLQAKRVGSTPMVVYNYFVREGSITQTKGNPAKVRKNVEDCMTVIERYVDYMKQHPECKWLRRMQSNMVVSVIANVAQYLYAERNEYLTRMKSFRVFPLSMEYQGSTYLRKARLINLSPRLAIMLLHLKNK
ncbi:MAG: glycosyltransferase [Paludibacteraceae bacterium]|nr:glycosyltransferase [Paludibacteraceae bacterium]